MRNGMQVWYATEDHITDIHQEDQISNNNYNVIVFTCSAKFELSWPEAQKLENNSKNDILNQRKYIIRKKVFPDERF